MVRIMDERKMMEYLTDGVYGYNGVSLTTNEIKLGIELCDEWINCHISDFWMAQNLNDTDYATEQANELVYTTTLKLELQKLLNK